MLINNRNVGRVWITPEDIKREVKLLPSATVSYEVEHTMMAINAAVPFMEKFPGNSACLALNDIARLPIERGRLKAP